jgi:hypothetical protein
LRQHERASVFRERLFKNEIGGFKGLDFELARRLRMEMKKGGKKKFAPAAIEEEKKEDDTVVARRKKSASSVKKEVSPKTSAPKTKKKESKEVPVPREAEPKVENAVLESDEISDQEEPNPFHFYPGPVRDVETYVEPHEIAAEDEERVAATKKADRSTKKKAKNHETSVAPVSPRKGIVYLPGDEKSTEKKRNLSKKFFQEEDTDFLAFNPRCPPAVKPWEYNEHERMRRSATANTSDEPICRELDWSLVELDSVEDIEEDVTESPSMANGKDVNAASLLYHCLLKDGGATNQEIDGVQRVARVDAEGAAETGTQPF